MFDILLRLITFKGKKKIYMYNVNRKANTENKKVSNNNRKGIFKK